MKINTIVIIREEQIQAIMKKLEKRERIEKSCNIPLHQKERFSFIQWRMGHCISAPNQLA
jgi:hypothetical protein